MYYVGTYSVTGTKMTAQVTASRHTKLAFDASVFGLEKVTLTMEGAVNGDKVNCSGSAVEAPGVTFGAQLTRLSD